MRGPLPRREDIAALEADWEPDTGFFWRVRQGIFEPAEFHRVLAKLRAMTVLSDEPLPRRLVSLLWNVPLFLHWQVGRVASQGGDAKAYERACGACAGMEFHTEFHGFR